MSQLDLRDYFATRAMQAFLSRELPEGHAWNKENIAKDAYDMADFMIKARENNESSSNNSDNRD